MKRRAQPAAPRAFTLLELLVALVIVAILAAMAYPDLHRHVIRTRRSEAQSALQQLMQQQERFFSQNNTYIAFSSDSTEARARLFKWWSGTSQAASAYEVEGKACDGELVSQCVQLVATPGTAKVDAHFHDTACQQLTLTSSGGKRASGPAEHCWP
jgi:type IV pilus assembly protein PilE